MRKTQGAGIGAWAALRPQIYNNTLVNVAQTMFGGILVQGQEHWIPNDTVVPSRDVSIYNNVVAVSGDRPVLEIREGGLVGSLYTASNAYFHDGKPIKISDARTGYVGGLGGWKAAGNDAGSFKADPRLGNDGYFTPNASSPLINAGVNNFGYDVFGRETSAGGINGAKHPVFAAGYVQDKIEYEDLVVNVGLRYDYIKTDNYSFRDATHPELTIDPTSGAINPAGLVKVPAFSALSPRLGLSFPVTDRTVFHTQFGQFVQQSRLRDIYQGLYLTASNVRGGLFIGTPVGFNVRPSRTTQYEIGFTQQIGDFASFDITGFILGQLTMKGCVVVLGVESCFDATVFKVGGTINGRLGNNSYLDIQPTFEFLGI